MHPQTDDFLSLFDGYREAHGAYVLQKDAKQTDKGKLTGRAATIQRHLTKELYDDHLMGRQGLGVIPINRNNLCRFAAIDVDEYGINHVALCTNIAKHKLPLIVCRTKSGGAHIYLFMKELSAAKEILMKMKEFAGFLGYGNCEIFPRQAQILADRGDLGNWINLPYFNASATTRYALDDSGRAITVDRFVALAHERSVRLSDLDEIHLEIPDVLPGGPPCLQRLISQGFPDGTRNNGLFNLGVYARKAYPADWKKFVESYNQKFMHPPLSSEEVLGVIKSLDRKDYLYTCKAQPIQSFCEAAKCRTCVHGIGGSDFGMPKFGSLSKLKTNPPIWFLDVETPDGGVRMELTTEELQSPIKFQARCMESVNVMPRVMKRDQWESIIAALMAEVNLVDMPAEATPQGQLFQYLEAFCTGRVQARSADEILLGKPWIEDGVIEFRFSDFLKYLERAKFRDIPLNKLAMYMKNVEGVTQSHRNIKGKGVGTWKVPAKNFQIQLEPFNVPKTSNDVL